MTSSDARSSIGGGVATNADYAVTGEEPSSSPFAPGVPETGIDAGASVNDIIDIEQSYRQQGYNSDDAGRTPMSTRGSSPSPDPPARPARAEDLDWLRATYKSITDKKRKAEQEIRRLDEQKKHIGQLMDRALASKRAKNAPGISELSCICCHESLLQGAEHWSGGIPPAADDPSIIHLGLVSYRCKCSRVRAIHLSCLVRNDGLCPHCKERAKIPVTSNEDIAFGT